MLGRDRMGLNPNDKLTKERSLKLLPGYFENNEIPPLYIDLKNKISKE
jgi:hypothetical protein